RGGRGWRCGDRGHGRRGSGLARIEAQVLLPDEPRLPVGGADGVPPASLALDRDGGTVLDPAEELRLLARPFAEPRALVQRRGIDHRGRQRDGGEDDPTELPVRALTHRRRALLSASPTSYGP